MNINNMIMYVIIASIILGAIDYCFNNKLGIGEQFKKGIMAMGQLALSMVGLMILTPVLSQVISPIVVPIYNFLGADPSMFAGTFFAIDMGGFQLAKSIALNSQAGRFSGIILSSMLGSTVTFTIPVGLSIIDENDQIFFAKGILCGIVTIPFGCFLGGALMGMPIKELCLNLLPIILISILIALCLVLFPRGVAITFKIFGKTLVVLSILGLVIGITQNLLNIELSKNLVSINYGVKTVANISFTLAGAFCFLSVVTRLLSNPLKKLGENIGVNSVSVAGIIASLANNLATFEMVKDMDDRGKIINFAFCVSGSFILGDHLGFTAIADKALLLPMIISKLTSSLMAVILAAAISKKL